jgi:hypothetical protein
LLTGHLVMKELRERRRPVAERVRSVALRAELRREGGGGEGL